MTVGIPLRVRQFFCRHECSIRKLHRRTELEDGLYMVECPCEKCGKLLVADCGLSLASKFNAKLVK